MKILTFTEAINKEPEKKKRHVLLGNGFSIACKSNIFSYGSLFERANFGNLSLNAKSAFEILNTTDFEEVMKALKSASQLVNLYSNNDSELAFTLEDDAVKLREVLVNAIALNHPAEPAEISEESYNHCVKFINNFHNIYTMNYDLLLYWTIMHEDKNRQVYDDGFRSSKAKYEDYVVWEVQKTDNQNVFYLHGALHLFDAKHKIIKYTWINTGTKLIDQIRDSLEKNMFPLIVAEGKSHQKLSHINHNTYLARCYRSFAKISNSLYIYGHSLADNDEHILRLIEENYKIKNVFISIYGDPNTEVNQRIINRGQVLGIARDDKHPLTVDFFDAKTAEVWGK